MPPVTRARGARLLALAALATASGCGGEDLETGDPVPPRTQVVTETTAATTGEAPAATPGDAEAGSATFESAGCVSCHTLAAAGSNATVGPNLDERMPTLDVAVDVITNGRGTMPPFGNQLSDEEIRNVATFVSESAGTG